jgi:hypothetical protein
VTVWTYSSTDLLTGRVLADTIPLNVQSFSSTMNGSGTLTGSLNFAADYRSNLPFINALACRRAVLWARADGWPVWAGVQWDWPDMSRANGTLPISAQTIDSLWGKRLITDTIEYQSVEAYAAFLDLLQYGLNKQSSYITSVSPAATRDPGYLAMVATQGRCARLVLPVPGNSGATWTAGYTYSDLTQVSSAWSDMVASGNLEFYFEPDLDENGNLAIYLRLGYVALGRPLSDTGLTLTYPGNCLDYGMPTTGSQGANMLWATAPPNGQTVSWMSAWPHGADLSDLGGYPLMESTVQWQGSVVTQQSQVDSFADGQVQLTTAGMTTPVLNVGGGAWPRPQDIHLGDAVYLSLTSQLHPPGPNGEPGYQGEVRITGITVYPDGPSQSSYMQLQTSAIPVAA